MATHKRSHGLRNAAIATGTAAAAAAALFAGNLAGAAAPAEGTVHGLGAPGAVSGSFVVILDASANKAELAKKYGGTSPAPTAPRSTASRRRAFRSTRPSASPPTPPSERSCRTSASASRRRRSSPVLGSGPHRPGRHRRRPEVHVPRQRRGRGDRVRHRHRRQDLPPGLRRPGDPRLRRRGQRRHRRRRQRPRHPRGGHHRRYLPRCRQEGQGRGRPCPGRQRLRHHRPGRGGHRLGDQEPLRSLGREHEPRRRCRRGAGRGGRARHLLRRDLRGGGRNESADAARARPPACPRRSPWRPAPRTTSSRTSRTSAP